MINYEHNDIATKSKLLGALNEKSTMGFEHNDIVTMAVMNKAIEEGGGGGGETITWILDNATATVTHNSDMGTYEAVFPLPETITADNLESTFDGKSVVAIYNGLKTQAPAQINDGEVSILSWNVSVNAPFYFKPYITDLYCVGDAPSEDEGETYTLSIGIVEE